MFARIPIYLPSARTPRSRGPRPVVMTVETDVEFPELTAAEAPVAFTTTEAQGTFSGFSGTAVTEEYRLYDGGIFRLHAGSMAAFVSGLASPLGGNAVSAQFLVYVRGLNWEGDPKPWPTGIERLINAGSDANAMRRCYAESDKVEITDEHAPHIAMWRRNFEIACSRFAIVDGRLWSRVAEPRITVSIDLRSGVPSSVRIGKGNIYDNVPGLSPPRPETFRNTDFSFSLADREQAVAFAEEAAAEQGHDWQPDRVATVDIVLPQALSVDHDFQDALAFARSLVNATQSDFGNERPAFDPYWLALSDLVGDVDPPAPQDFDEAFHAFLEAGAREPGPGRAAPLAGVSSTILRLKVNRWDNRRIETAAPGNAAPGNAAPAR